MYVEPHSLDPAEQLAHSHIRALNDETLRLLGVKPQRAGHPTRRFERERDHMGRFLPIEDED